MTSLSPTATYSAELHERLDDVGRVLALHRAIVWGARGLLLGLLVDLTLVGWAWTFDAQALFPRPALALLPVFLGLIAGLAASLVRQSHPALARRVDHAAGLQERSLTALELSERGGDHPLVLAQLRDTVEHLKRMEPLDTFPVKPPKRELLAALIVTVLCIMVAFAPNPWLTRARANSPAITAARDQAQRVEKLAESIQGDTEEINRLRDLLRQGAQTVQTRSAAPEEALASLEELEAALQQMSSGDDELASALAAIAGALAGNGSTADLATAINTGDMREISRAAKGLGQRTEQMDETERQQVARTLRDAANRAGRSSPPTAGALEDAANALDGGNGSQGESGEEGGGLRQGGARGGMAGSRTAREALDDLGNSAAAAAERQRAQSQLEASRNALERSLNRTQSRSGGQPGQSGANGQRRGAGGSATEDGGEMGDPSGEDGMGSGGGMGGEGDDPGGSGFGSGSGMSGLGGVTDFGAITRPENVNGGAFSPDESIENPYLGEAGDGMAYADERDMGPTAFQRGNTQNGGSGTIPLGMRDLVERYFSSLDQR